MQDCEKKRKKKKSLTGFTKYALFYEKQKATHKLALVKVLIDVIIADLVSLDFSCSNDKKQ